MDRYRGGGESDSYDTNRRMPPSPSEVPLNRNPSNNFRPGFSSGGGGGRSSNFHSPPPHTHGGGGGGGRSSNFHSPPPANRGGGRSNFHSPPPSQGGGGDGVSGFSGGGGRSSNFHSPPPPSNHAHGGGGGGGFSNGGGFRPMGPAPSSFNGGGMPISGQKRGFPFSPRGGSPPDNTGGGAAYAKLFIGSVPATATEEEVRPLFEAHGDVLEVCLLKDKKTGQQSGCCFIKYATSEDAERAIRALHNQCTLRGGTGPIQVRYADGERERLGAVEHKLFVGSMNRHATEKEIQEIFAPYGLVEDVYIMRDELKQSRGCGFVKFSQRDMAAAAINALNGTYLMRGCEQPLTVRFADPKRPRVGDSRGSPALGGPGFGPRSQATSGFRPTSNPGDYMGGRGPPGTWNPMGPQNAGPYSDANAHGLSGQFGTRSGVPPVASATSGPMGGFGGPSNGSLPALAPIPSPISQQNHNQSVSQKSSGGQQVSPLSKPLQSPSDLLPPVQLQSQNTPVSSYSQTPTQQSQLQFSNSAVRPSLNQAFPSQHPSGSLGQVPVSQPQVQQTGSVAPQLMPPNLRQGVSGPAGIPQQQQQMHQPPYQAPSQLAQAISQQTQALQASYQSSKQAFSQIQQQMHMMQQSGQNLFQPQNAQATKLQSPWSGNIPPGQTVSSSPATAAAVPGSSTTAATTPALAPIVGQVALPPCNWTEHTSPAGYKYYYNSVTSESKWEKPEELTLFEQRQQQKLSHPQKPPVQQYQSQTQSQSQPQVQSQTQSQSQPQVQSTKQGSQSQHSQIQPQMRNHQQLQQQPSSISPYQGSGFVGHQNAQEVGYAQSQGSANSVADPARFHQGLQAQEWAWKNKPTGA